MQPARSHRLAAVAVAALLATGFAVTAAPAASAAPGPTVTIDNTLPNWLPRAQPSVARMSLPQTMSVRVYLAPRGGVAALQAKVDALSNPASSQYRHWLSVDQYSKAYAPTQATVDAVSAYLKSAGLAITGVEAQHRYIAVSGSTAQLGRAFGVTLRSYSHDGQSVTAPSSAVTLPAAVGSAVLTVTGLDTTTTRFDHDHITPDDNSKATASRTANATPATAGAAVTPPDGFVNGRPCSLTFGTLQARYQADFVTPLPKFQGAYLPYSPCGYTGAQFRSAYENNSALAGAGVTVGITDAYRWQKIASDASRYAANHGDAPYARGQLTESLPGRYTDQDACDPSGWSGEETLDVEAVHAMAQAANIRYYASASCNDVDFLDTLARVVDENKVQVVSNSWGDLESNSTSDSVAAYQQVLLQAGAQGISFLWSSGDDGDELASSGLKQADFPASDPLATAVGGTATAIDADGKIASQTGWGTQKYSLSADGQSWDPVGYLYGAGGGFSSLFNRPAYQNGVVPASSPAGRAVPDVAMDADPSTGMLIGQTQTFPEGVHYGEYRIGGTSLASPLFAGLTALYIQGAGGGRLGLLNPLLYQHRNLFTDVKKTPKVQGVVRADNANGLDPADGILYSVRTFGQDSSLEVKAGWDPVTGIGVPNGKNLPAVAAAAR